MGDYMMEKVHPLWMVPPEDDLSPEDRTKLITDPEFAKQHSVRMMHLSNAKAKKLGKSMLIEDIGTASPPPSTLAPEPKPDDPTTGPGKPGETSGTSEPAKPAPSTPRTP